jgi:hypothetical protein
MFGILFYLFFILLVSGRCCLDVLLFENIQDYEEKILSNNEQEARQVFLDQVDPICFLSLVHTIACIP